MASQPRFGAIVPGAHHIELASGRFLDLADPCADDITLEDVAHGLSNTCRFAGQSSRFYSVAEHALLCAAYVRATGGSPSTRLAALHHDDHEAYMGDVTRPLKALMPGYSAMAERLQAVIAVALGLPAIYGRAAVKVADDWALSAEAYYLVPSKGSTWFCAGYFEEALPVVPWVDQLGLSPASARVRWLREHARLLALAGEPARDEERP